MPLVEVDWELYCIIMLMKRDPMMDRAIRRYARRFISNGGSDFYDACEAAIRHG